MIVFNQTIFNLYNPILTTTEEGWKNYTKGECVDALLPDTPRNYTQLVHELTTMLLHHGGAIWLENEVEEYIHTGGQIIKMPDNPVGAQIYEDIKSQVVKYLRRVTLQYCFWLIEKGISKDSWLGIVINDLDKLQGAHFYIIPTLKDGVLPTWFTSKMIHLAQEVNNRFEVNITIGDEPDIIQHGSVELFPYESRVYAQTKLKAPLKPVTKPSRVHKNVGKSTRKE